MLSSKSFIHDSTCAFATGLVFSLNINKNVHRLTLIKLAVSQQVQHLFLLNSIYLFYFLTVFNSIRDLVLNIGIYLVAAPVIPFVIITVIFALMDIQVAIVVKIYLE